MTLTTKSQHRKDRERSESSEWKPCGFCNEIKHTSNLNTKQEGIYFCDNDCAQRHKEEVLE